MKPFVATVLLTISASLTHFGGTPSARHDESSAGVLFALIRQGDRIAINESLKRPAMLEVRDEHGNTPLLYAALYLDAGMIEQMLEKGADPNATNKAGASALMWAVSDPAKVRVLLKHGARVNAAAVTGNTPLIIASHQYGSAETLKELLAHGADVRAVTAAGETAVRAAARAGDVEALRILLDHGGDVNQDSRTTYSATAKVTPLMMAAQLGHLDCVQLLIERGADVRFTSDSGNALHFAAFTDRKEIARLLVDRGANVNARGKRITSFRNDPELTPLMYAAMSERDDPGLVQLLIDRGADLNARAASGETAMWLAQRRGETKIVAALRAAGAESVETNSESSNQPPLWRNDDIEDLSPATVRKAVEAGLALLVESGSRFTEETANRCFSCHQHSQPALALGIAQEKGFSFDKAAATELVNASLRTAGRRMWSAIEEPLPVPSISAWLLIGLHAAGQPSSPLTDAYAYSLARSQFVDGRWVAKAARAPMDYSDVTSTALAIRALHVSSSPTMKSRFDQSIAAAASWLRGYDPQSTEERALQLLGLHWAGEARPALAGRAKALQSEQREDGGWAQLPTLQTDAYATGLALYALNQACGLSASDPVYRKGMKFLLRKQLNDGSWFVATRASPVQVAIDDIFPHGTHQWISSAATCWSTMALMLGSENDN